MKKKILPVVWVLSVLLLGVLASVLSGESTHFFGIADDQEQTISFEQPVEIVRTLVVEGEEVQQGDLLMEVRRENLNTSLAIIEDKLQELTSRNNEETATLQSKLISLKAKQDAQRVDMNSQIKSLQSRYELNRSFLAQLDTSEGDTKKTAGKTKLNPLLDKISGLKIQRRHLQESMQAEIDNIQSQLDASERPIDAQIAGLEDKKEELLRQVSNLQIRANFNGRVGSLLFKAGETVSPYQALLTVHSANPSFVKAYINENVVNKVKLGQKVWVQPNTSSAEGIIVVGKVESLGSRIVEYPERLKKNKFVSAWGREVVVHLEQDHSLLLGEKVIVQLNKPGSMLATLFSGANVVADVVTDGMAATELDGVPVYSRDETSFLLSSVAAIDARDVEASGILRAPKRVGYLMISDEAKNGHVELYRVDRNGMIISRAQIDMQGQKMPKIDDLESISSDGRFIYLASSLSRNKRDILKPKRRQLLRLEQRGSEFIFSGSIDLYTYLEDLLEAAKTDVALSDTKSEKFLHYAIASRSMDIEAHSVWNGDLYLGFKAPLNSKGESVILRLKNIDAIFSGKQTRGNIWRRLNLQDSMSGEATMLSDMLIQDGRLLLLSVKTDRHHPVSYLWSLDLNSNKLKKLAIFRDLKAEGIASSSLDESKHIIVFDEGGKTPSRRLTVNTEEVSLAGSL